MDAIIPLIGLVIAGLAVSYWVIARLHWKMPEGGNINRIICACIALLGVSTLAAPVQAAPAPIMLPGQGCTVFYASDGQTALGGNNEDFNDPMTLVWFIPASPGQHGRVYFGYDDYIPQGGMNDQGVFFDGLALEYKSMPLTDQRPRYPGTAIKQLDQALASSANVQDVLDTYNHWYHLGGEYFQQLFGDRYGNSLIIDGDTVLRKQGAFQLATNFRLVDHPNPPYPDERYGVAYDALSKADTFSVDLFRQVLDRAHAEGDYPTLYSQVYELNTGIIHLYQYHDYQHEVVLNLADELAKGPHVETIASLFPKNPDYETWAYQQKLQWKVNYEENINPQIAPASLAWMSGQYVLREEGDDVPVKVYLEKDQLYLQRPNELPIELYPSSADTVFHHFFNGEDLTLTFQHSQWGEASGAQGSFRLNSYNLDESYRLSRTGGFSPTFTPWMGIAGAILGLVLLGGFVWSFRKRSGKVVAKT
jgi:hypothetical protein